MKGNNVIKSVSVLAVIGLVGCSTVNVEEMEQLDGDGVRNILVGKTLTYTTDYGKFAEYTQPGQLTGVGRASGSWGAEKANSTHTVSEDGELCTHYEAEYEWSKPEYEYCTVFFTDTKGKYFAKHTKNDSKPERVGEIRAVTSAEGDTYNLLN